MDHVEDSRPLRCTACGSSALEQGFLNNKGQYSGGHDRWVSGTAEVGMGNKPKRMGLRKSGYVIAIRCRDCSHLDLYVRGIY